MRLSDRKVRLRAVWLIILPFLWFAEPTPATLGIGLVLAAVGGAIRAWAAGHIRKDSTLTVSGPYAHVRNPLYVGSLLVGAGVTLAGGQPLFLGLFLLFYLLVYRRTALDEANLLTELFGEEYRRYAAAVPLFIPRPTPWRDGAAKEGAAPRFSPALYRRNREWEAGLGIAAGFVFLFLRGWIGG